MIRSCQAEWAARRRANLEFRVEEATACCRLPRAFDLAAAIEVLEHVPDRADPGRDGPGDRRHLLVSVPDEPLWRILNVARGAYIRDLGNTPGHVNHWSQAHLRAYRGPLRRGDRGALAVSVDDAARRETVADDGSQRRYERPDRRQTTAKPRRATEPTRTGANGAQNAAGADGAAAPAANHSYASGARILSIGIASTGVLHLRCIWPRPRATTLDPASYSRISLCWAIMFVILSVIYRPIEQWLSRMIRSTAGPAGGMGHPPADPGPDPLGFASLFLIVALAMRSEIEQGMFDGSSALYWILVIGVPA